MAAALRICLRARVVPQPMAVGPCRGARRGRAHVQDHPERGLEAHPGRRPDRADIAAAVGDGRAALFHAGVDQPAAAELVCAPVPRRGALPVLCAVESGLNAGTAELSAADRTTCIPACPGMGMVGGVSGVRGIERGAVSPDPGRAERGRRRPGLAAGGRTPGPRPADVGAAARLCIGPAARRDQSHHAKHRGHTAVLGGAAGSLPAELHIDIREHALVPPRTFGAVCTGAAGDGIRAGRTRAGSAPGDSAAAVPRRPVPVLHGMPRRTGEDQACDTLADELLSDGGVRRRARRFVRGRGGARDVSGPVGVSHPAGAHAGGDSDPAAAGTSGPAGHPGARGLTGRRSAGSAAARASGPCGRYPRWRSSVWRVTSRRDNGRIAALRAS